jgi:hypothetical protein
MSMRAALLLLALLLAGCSSSPPAPQAGIDRIEAVALMDDVDCDGVVDIFMEVRAVSDDSRLPVPFDGHFDATLSRLVVGSTYAPVDNWSADLTVDKFSPDGTIQWFEQGQKLTPGTYRLDAAARVNGEGNFTTQTSVDYRPLRLAAGLRAC